MIAGRSDVDGVAVVRLPLDVDAANAARLREELIACVPEGGQDLVIDLAGTRYLDSAGIDMLFRLGQRLSERRADLRVVIPPGSQIGRLTTIVGLGTAMPVYESVGEAVAASRTASPAAEAAGDADADADELHEADTAG